MSNLEKAMIVKFSHVALKCPSEAVWDRCLLELLEQGYNRSGLCSGVDETHLTED